MSPPHGAGLQGDGSSLPADSPKKDPPSPAMERFLINFEKYLEATTEQRALDQAELREQRALDHAERALDRAELRARLDDLRLRMDRAHAGNNHHQASPDWSKALLYSETMKTKLGATTPLEQYGVYGTVGGGAIYCASAFNKASHLMQAARTDGEERAMHKAIAWATEDQVKNASFTARRFRAQGVTAALGAPLLWLAYVRSKHAK